MKVIEKKLLFILLVIVTILVVLSIPDDSKMGEVYFKSYKVDEAYEYYKKAENKGDQSVSIQKKVREYYLVQGNLVKALEMQKKIVKSLTKSKVELLELEKLYRWTGDIYSSLLTKEKRALLEVDQKKQNELLLEVSAGFRWLRKYDDLERVATFLFVNSSKDSLEPSLEYYISTGQYKKIIELTESLERQGNLTKELMLMRAQSHELLGNLEEAIVAYKNYMFFNIEDKDRTARIEVDVPDSKFYKENLGTYEKIIELLTLSQNSEALIGLYENILSVNPKAYEIAFSLSELYALKNNKIEQKRVLLSLYESQSANILYRVADTFRGLGELNVAIEFLTKLIDIEPDEIQYRKLIAEIYEENKNFEDALRQRYNIRKILERKMPRTTQKYLAHWGSVFIAANEGGKVNFFLQNEIRENHKIIIFLLERVGRDEELTLELELYNKRYPTDLAMKKYLASRYAENNNSEKAKKLYKDIYEQSYLDKDATLFVADDLLSKGLYSEALEKIESYPDNRSDDEFLNRRFSIYEITDVKRADDICRGVEDRLVNRDDSFAYVDLVARCFEREGDRPSAIETYLVYINAHPLERYPKVALGFSYVRAERLTEAQLVINDLKKDLIDKDVIALEKSLLETQNIINRRDAFELTTFYEYFIRANDQSKYTQFFLEILKNFKNHAFGVDLGIQDPIFPSSYKSNLGLVYRYNMNSHVFKIVGGVNFDNDETVYSRLSYNHNLDLSSALGFYLDYNSQIFNLLNFDDTLGGTKDIARIEYYKRRASSDEFFATIELSDFYVQKRSLSASYWAVSTQYDKYFNNLFSLGPYIYILRERGTSGFPENILVDKVTVLAIHGRYKHIPPSDERKLSNVSDFYIGSDLESETSGLNFFSITNRTIYELDEDNSLEFEIQASRQLEVEQDDTVYRARLTYNYWYY